jgi:hypothetical protein
VIKRQAKETECRPPKVHRGARRTGVDADVQGASSRICSSARLAIVQQFQWRSAAIRYRKAHAGNNEPFPNGSTSNWQMR